MKAAQVDLRSGTTILTCWLAPRVKTGDQVTLKGDPRRWDVLRVGATRDMDGIHTTWHNSI